MSNHTQAVGQQTGHFEQFQDTGGKKYANAFSKSGKKDGNAWAF